MSQSSSNDSLETSNMILDDATFEEVVKAQYEPLYRFAFSLVQRESDARDLTQEAFEQLGRKSHQVQDKAKLKSWLFTTLYRAFVDSHRWKTRYPHVEAGDAVSEMPANMPDAEWLIRSWGCTWAGCPWPAIALSRRACGSM